MRKSCLLFISIFLTASSACFFASPEASAKDPSALIARGNGTAGISGTGSIEIICNGFLIVSGETEFEIYEDGQAGIELGDGRVLYINLDGKVTVSGEDMEVVCGGTIIYMRTRLSGNVILTGSGYYRTGWGLQFWNSDGVEIPLENF